MRFRAAPDMWRTAYGRAAAALMWIVSLGGASAEAELVDRIVAIIDRDVIVLSEAEQAMWLVELRTNREANVRDVVEQMIEARLIGREVARFTDAAVADEDVEAQISQLRSSFDSEESFQAVLSMRGMSEAELRNELQRQLAVNRYLERRFRALTYVTEDDVERYFTDEILPALAAEREPSVEETDQIRRILEERRFNERVEQWIDGLKARTRIRRYVW